MPSVTVPQLHHLQTVRARTSIKMLLIDEDDQKDVGYSHSHNKSPSSPSLASIGVITPASTPFSPTEQEQKNLKSQLDSVKSHLQADNESDQDNNYAFISHSPSTFPYKQPSIDNAQLARRKRRRTSASELSVLENKYKENPKPSKWNREQIAQQVGMTEKAVQIWFQNKRQSCRKNQLKVESQMESMLEIPFLRTNSVSNDIHHPRELFTPLLSESNRLPPIQAPATPIASPPTNTSSTSFTIYNDQMSTIPPPTQTPQMLRLSMSCDGKAELVVTKRANSTTSPTISSTNSIPRTPLAATPTNALNRKLPLLSDSFRSQKPSLSSTNAPPTKDIREAECITNLLSLRSGLWN